MPPPPDPDATGAYVPPPPPDGGERFTAGTVLAGRYRIVAPLGRGGMGEVYRADDLTLGQPVALKFLPKHLADDPGRLARFRKEVALARNVSHPNVCRVYDLAEHGGDSFLTMEFVDGEDLGSVLRRLGRVPEEKGVEVARQLCSALIAVHDQGLLHRDLKPANVMLDGRGRVRLTDFGLAAAAVDLSATEVRAGTPLYQAPEQLSGKELTARSDLYALGLVLYELFTGRRAYADVSRGTPPSKPSSHVSTLNPAIEAVIMRCLTPDPADRPRSAMEVLARLPGGDPLAAAVAAGETPSPRMVADAPVEGTLRPAVAGALFAFVFAGLIAIAWFNDRDKAYRHTPLPWPAEMEFRAKALVRELGYTDPPRHVVSGYVNDNDNLRALRRGVFVDLPDSERPHLAAARPALAVFFYRESPRFLGHGRREGVTIIGERDFVSAHNPPNDEPGMVGVVLDTHYRLVGFTAVPKADSPPPATSLEWAVLLKAAGLDGPGVLKAVPNPDPPVTPPVFADRTAAWDGTYPERQDVRIRVEAGSFRGRPVYFKLTHPDRPDGPLRENEFRPQNPAAEIFSALFALAILVALGFFAIRNFRRADVRGALLLGGVLFLLLMLEWAFSGRHLFSVDVELTRLTQTLGRTLFFVVLIIVGYLTLEPVVRRRCPHLLTAWTRLFAGRWRDPLVGRDVLFGAAAAIVLAADVPGRLLLYSPQGTVVVQDRAFTSPGQTLFFILGYTIGLMWFYASIFAVFLAVVRRQWAAFGLLLGFLLHGFLPESNPGTWHVILTVLAIVLGIAVFARLGILAVISFAFVRLLSMSPLTLDPSAWYFGAATTYLVVLVALTGFAAWTSLGSRPLFRAWDD